MVAHEYRLNVTPGEAALRVRLSQGDTNFTLAFTLYSNTGDLNIESGSSIALQGSHPDGSSFTVAGSLSGTVASFNGNAAMTAIRGDSIAELVITKNGKRLSTSNFVLEIEPAA